MALPGEHSLADEIVCVEKPASVEQVDEAAYLDANPDVRNAGMSAREHFRSFGRFEGRLQWANCARLAEMREEKLRSLRFRREPTTPRAHGQAANFLTPDIVTEFDIPDSPPVSANQYGGPFIDEIRGNPHALCLDVGAGLRYTYAINVVNTDIYRSLSTDVLCVGEDLPFESEQFDYVICAAVLEHTRRPWQVAREICRVLKPGGKLLVDYPFLQGVHGYPHHYFNATPQGAISLFEGACDILSSTIEPNNHPMQSLWWVLKTWQNGLAGADRARFEQLTIGEILETPSDEHLEAAYCKNLSEAAQRVIPAGSTVVARKKTDAAAEPDPGAALRAELAAMRASLSWRVTAALRALRHRLR